MRQPTRPAPPPLQVNAAAVVAVGTAIWLVALVLTLAFHGRLADHGHDDWVWIALAGFALGLLGLPLMRAQAKAAARRSESRRTADEQAAD